MRKIYLAGPDVFREKPGEFFNEIKEKLKFIGFEALVPHDTDLIMSSIPPHEFSLKIYKNNMEMIDQCDIVLANIIPFRGPSADVGTVFEMGYAKGIGKRVLAYSEWLDLNYKTRIFIDSGLLNLVGSRYPAIEDFKLTDNLMVVYGAEKIFSSLDDVLKHLKEEDLKNE